MREYDDENDVVKEIALYYYGKQTQEKNIQELKIFFPKLFTKNV